MKRSITLESVHDLVLATPFQFLEGSSVLGFLAAGVRPFLEAAGKNPPDRRIGRSTSMQSGKP